MALLLLIVLVQVSMKVFSTERNEMQVNLIQFNGKPSDSLN